MMSGVLTLGVGTQAGGEAMLGPLLRPVSQDAPEDRPPRTVLFTPGVTQTRVACDLCYLEHVILLLPAGGSLADVLAQLDT